MLAGLVLTAPCDCGLLALCQAPHPGHSIASGTFSLTPQKKINKLSGGPAPAPHHGQFFYPAVRSDGLNACSDATFVRVRATVTPAGLLQALLTFDPVRAYCVLKIIGVFIELAGLLAC